MKEFWKTEENLWISSEKEMDPILHLAEIIEEIMMFDFSALPGLQSLMETALSQVIILMEGKESTTNISLAVSEFYNAIQKYVQDHLRIWMKEKTDIFWQMVKTVSRELDSGVTHARSLAQEGKKELQVVYNILSSLKTLFSEEDLETAVFCYLEHFFDISPECIVNTGCNGFYLSNVTSVNLSAEFNSLLLPLDSVFFNITNLEDKVSVPSALHCTYMWLQTWTEIFEETSKILNLNSTFFVYLRNDLTDLSESILNTTHVELCNRSTIAIVEATSAMNLLKIIVEGGNSSDWKDFETYLAIIQSVFENAVDVESSLKGNSSDDILEMIEVVVTELQQSILKVVNRDFLNFWLNTFISGGSRGERGSSEFSIGNSLSTILRLSQKELGSILAEIKDTASFLTYAHQYKYLVCANTFQNITKLIFDSILKNISYSQVNFSSHIHSFLKSYSIIEEVEDCDGWIHKLHNFSEKYKSPSRLENAKHILFLLQSLGNTEMDTKLESIVDFINSIFNLMIPECSVTGSDVICVNIYFNMIARTLRVILPEFNVQGDINVLEYIFTLLNNSGGLIQMAVNNLMGHSPYTSNDTHFNHSVYGSNRTSRAFLNPFHNVLLSSIELMSEIQYLLKNKTFGMQESSSSPLDIGIDEKNISLSMKIFQAAISKLSKLYSNLPRELQGEYNIFLERLIEKAALNDKLVGKALKIFKSSSLASFPIGDDREFLELIISIVQNLKNMDIEFLIGQFKQVQRSLDNFFKNIKPLHIETSELGMLIDWWDTFENNSCNWNLTGLWQITQLFQEGDVEEMFHLLLDVISLTESLAHSNITEALADVYTFVLTQEAQMPIFTKEEISNQVESLLILLEELTDMSDETAEASICFSSEFCWILKTGTPQSDPTSNPCDFMQSNFSLNHNAVLNVIKELKFVILNDSFLCTMEDFFQTDITHNLSCFFYQIKEWNSVLLKFSELRHINGSLLTELLAFWNELYLYTVPLEENNTNSIVNCSSTSKRKVAFQIVETLSSMPAAEMEMSEYVLEQLNDLYGGLSWNKHSRISLIEIVFPYVKNMTSEISGLLDIEAVYSFLSVVQPLMTLSSVGNEAYSVLMVLSSLNGNNNISNNIENIWFPVVKSLEDLLLNFNVRQSLAVIEQEFQLLRLASGQSSSAALDVLIPQFNVSSVEAVLRTFEDIQEIVSSFLCECNNQNYSKMVQPLILLMAIEKSSDLLLVVKDIIDFLELFQNKSEEDYTKEPVVTSNLFCVVSKCKDSMMHHLVISVIEGITLVQDHYQSIGRTWLTFNKGDCESMAYINLKLSDQLESFLRALQNTTDSGCNCQLMLENIQSRLQK
ncbi:UNVERIFIED_CONTAM: hypothetical protein H355_001680 [Colinus virginianus]|nr:hypothetical protein H355_001680 [Colinus virginianus]